MGDDETAGTGESTRASAWQEFFESNNPTSELSRLTELVASFDNAGLLDSVKELVKFPPTSQLLKRSDSSEVQDAAKHYLSASQLGAVRSSLEGALDQTQFENLRQWANRFLGQSSSEDAQWPSEIEPLLEQAAALVEEPGIVSGETLGFTREEMVLIVQMYLLLCVLVAAAASGQLIVAALVLDRIIVLLKPHAIDDGDRSKD